MPRLSPLERAVYVPVCQGLTDAEIAKQLNNKWSKQAITGVVQQLFAKLKKTRLELILDYTENHCPHKDLPLAAFEGAVEQMSTLHRQERRVLEAYLGQWQAYRTRSPGSTMPRPTKQSVVAEIGLCRTSVTKVQGKLYRRVIGEGRAHPFKLIRLFHMATLYPRAAGIAADRLFPYPPGLSLSDRKLYRALCYGTGTKDIVVATGRSYSAVIKRIQVLTQRLGWSREEVALRFTAGHCPDALLPLRAYDEAVRKTAGLTDRHEAVLREFVVQWRGYIATPADQRGEPPSYSGVAKACGLRPEAMKDLFTPVAVELGIAHYKRASRWCKLIRWYDMAQRRAEMPDM